MPEMTDRDLRVITLLREANADLDGWDEAVIEATNTLTKAQKTFDEMLRRRNQCIAQIGILINELPKGDK